MMKTFRTRRNELRDFHNTQNDSDTGFRQKMDAVQLCSKLQALNDTTRIG